MCARMSVVVPASLPLMLGAMSQELKAYVERRVAKELLATSFYGSESVAALLLAVKDITARLTTLEGYIDEMRVQGGLESKALPQGTLLRKSASSVARGASLRRSATSSLLPATNVNGLQSSTFSSSSAAEARRFGAVNGSADVDERPEVRRTMRSASAALTPPAEGEGAVWDGGTNVAIDLGFTVAADRQPRQAEAHQTVEDASAHEPARTPSPSHARPEPPTPSPAPPASAPTPGDKEGDQVGSDTWNTLRAKQLTYKQMKQKAQAAAGRG